eukprot:6009027-Alexandrium_andersonii.AAC.1
MLLRPVLGESRSYHAQRAKQPSPRLGLRGIQSPRNADPGAGGAIRSAMPPARASEKRGSDVLHIPGH